MLGKEGADDKERFYPGKCSGEFGLRTQNREPTPLAVTGADTVDTPGALIPDGVVVGLVATFFDVVTASGDVFGCGARIPDFLTPTPTTEADFFSVSVMTGATATSSA